MYNVEHPFVGDLSGKKLEELQESIDSLTKKLTFAYRMQNTEMIRQMHMVLESYRSEYGRRMQALYEKQNIQNNIQISKDNG
jgi:hypothetical protein